MSYSMNFNNFKKVISVATVFTIVACLVPESAQAGYAKGSGESGNSAQFSFKLNLDQSNFSQKNNEGFFPEAIQEFKVNGFFTTPRLCGQEVDFCNGNITVTKLTEENGKIPGLNFGLNGLDKILNLDISRNPFDRNLKPNVFSKNVLRYDVNLDDKADSELIWFIESNEPNLLNDLSGLSRFKGALGIFPEDVAVLDNGEADDQKAGVFEISLQAVPEPTSTASLLSIGALGAVSLLKRKKPLKKTNGLNQ